jgi:hypothetical protein
VGGLRWSEESWSGHERPWMIGADESGRGPSSFGHVRRSTSAIHIAAQSQREPARGGARARSGENRMSRGDDGAAHVAAAAEQGVCGGRVADAYESGDWLPTRPTRRSAERAERRAGAGDCSCEGIPPMAF